jgi:hypothetical protein
VAPSCSTPVVSDGTAVTCCAGTATP